MNEPAYVSDLLAVLGQPTRLRILNLLGMRPLCVCELQQILGLPEPTVSRHLAMLRGSRLVTVERHGQRRVYGLASSDAPVFPVLRRFLADIGRKERCLRHDLAVLRGSARKPEPRVRGRQEPADRKEVHPMKIEILGPGCVRCKTTEENVRQALKALGMDAEVTHIYDRREFEACGVKFTPAVAIDGRVKSSGRIPEAAEIQRWLREAVAEPAAAGGLRR